MSLELAIQANTAAIHSLIGILSSPLAGNGDVLRPQAAVGNNNTASDTAETTFVKPEVVAKNKKPATASTEQPAATLTATVEEVAVGVTYDEVKKVILKLVEDKGKDTAIAVLKKFNAGKLPDVDPSHFADVIKACEAA